MPRNGALGLLEGVEVGHGSNHIYPPEAPRGTVVLS